MSGFFMYKIFLQCCVVGNFCILSERLKGGAYTILYALVTLLKNLSLIDELL